MYETIHLVSIAIEVPEQPTFGVRIEIELDGKPFHPEHPIDLRELLRSCQGAGEFEIFTCGCGVAACAGIHGIEISHTEEAIEWKCPDPLSARDEAPAGREQGVTTFDVHTFDPNQYIGAIDEGIRKLQTLIVMAARRIKLPVYGSAVQDVLDLETLRFSTRTVEPGRRVIASKLEVDAYHDLLTVGGVYHRFADLALPPALVAQREAWTALRCFPQDASELPRYLQYLQAGREFCHALHKYIGQQTAVHFRYHPPAVYNGLAWEIIEDIR